MHYSQDLVQAWQNEHLAQFGKTISYELAELEMRELVEVLRITLPKEEKQNAQQPTNAE